MAAIFKAFKSLATPAIKLGKLLEPSFKDIFIHGNIPAAPDFKSFTPQNIKEGLGKELDIVVDVVEIFAELGLATAVVASVIATGGADIPILVGALEAVSVAAPAVAVDLGVLVGVSATAVSVIDAVIDELFPKPSKPTPERTSPKEPEPEPEPEETDSDIPKPQQPSRPVNETKQPGKKHLDQFDKTQNNLHDLLSSIDI